MEKAIIAFQSSNGLYTTGTLNFKTLSKLTTQVKQQIDMALAVCTVKEIANGEINKDTAPPLLITGILAGAIILWVMNKKKKAVGLVK